MHVHQMCKIPACIYFIYNLRLLHIKFQFRKKNKMNLIELNLKYNESLLFRKLDILLNLMLTKTQ